MTTRAVAPRLHARQHGLHGEERALDVGLEGQGEFGLVDVLERQPLAADAGVVDQDVDLPERLFGLGDAAVERRDVADVVDDDMRLAPVGADPLRGFLRVLCIDVVDDDIRAALRHDFRVAPPDPPAGAGDQCSLPLQ